jgi:3-deoxy-D-manno-octulosonic-acid transferase
MFFLYSILLYVASVVLLPRFIFDAITKGKYAAGFRQRLGFVPVVEADDRPVVWLHCVSVGETNAARPLVEKLAQAYPDLRLVLSTTTRTGQNLARELFGNTAEHIFYFPYDFKSTVRRSLRRIKPDAVLLMETELWFNFIREANHHRAKLALVNGRLSERSFRRYRYIGGFMKRVLSYLDVALMQENADATRLIGLGAHARKVKVTGNLKFDREATHGSAGLADRLRERFRIEPDAPLIIAASTHAPEEKYVLEAFREVWKTAESRFPRLMIAPRHPERFDEVHRMISATGFTSVRRSTFNNGADAEAEIILLDSIGELRHVYPLASVVFVGGSLIPHGGQSIFEPAESGRAIVTGPHTANFAAAVKEFLERDALIQLPEASDRAIPATLARTLTELLNDEHRLNRLGEAARSVMENNRGAADRTVEYLAPLLAVNRSK